MDPAAPSPATPPSDGGVPAPAAVPAVAPAAAVVPAAAPVAPVAAQPNQQPPAAPAAPVPYQPFAVPEGVTLNADLTAEFSAVAQDLKLPQEAAQRVLNVGIKMRQKWGEEQTAALSTARDGWKTTAKSDQEIGGEKFDSNVAIAGNVFKTFGTPALKQLLEDSGLGDHPEMVRWARRVAAAVGEDRFIGGQAPKTPADQSLESRAASKLYGGTSLTAAA